MKKISEMKSKDPERNKEGVKSNEIICKWKKMFALAACPSLFF